MIRARSGWAGTAGQACELWRLGDSYESFRAFLLPAGSARHIASNRHIFTQAASAGCGFAQWQVEPAWLGKTL